jgi:3-oxoacyl-[acyl-carrier protein] reductase/meso-butanediol dehydrogenase/(S,S)-butanediol dehydrogenase/diacetyl reductase
MGNKRTVIITGGTKGIGASIAQAFHKEGYHILIGARHDNELVKELGDRALFFPLDVTNPTHLKEIVQKAIKWSGQLDVFVNNAGFSEWMPLEQINEEFWQRMLDTNLKSVLFGCQAAVSELKAGGAIINVSSIAGKRGTSNNSVYCASKFGVNGITQALAKELGAKGIRVNAVCPVLVKTEGLVDALNGKYSPAQGKSVDKFLADFIQGNSALGRLPTGSEVAALCLFLASDKASAITGQCINVDCGVLPQ